MILERFVSGRARSNAYLFASADADRCVIVDPGAGAAKPLEARLRELGAEPAGVLLTHGHPDHVWSARAMCDRYRVPAYLHPADRRWVLGRKRPREVIDVCADQTVVVAGMTFEVRHTPGHTRGGVCYLAGDVCFTGDTVFARGPGHTVYPGGDRRTLRRSIATQILTLPDSVRLVPGHGPETTVGRARGFLEAYVDGGTTKGREQWTS